MLRDPTLPTVDAFDAMLRTLGYERLLLPQSTTTFDAGVVFRDHSTQTVLDNLKAFCGAKIEPLEGDGPTEIQRSSSFQIDLASKVGGNKLFDLLGSQAVTVTASAEYRAARYAEVSLTNIRLRTLGESAIEAALAQNCCAVRLANASGGSAEIATSVLVGDVRLVFYDQEGHQVRLGASSTFWSCTSDEKTAKVDSGSVIAKRVAFAFQPVARRPSLTTEEVSREVTWTGEHTIDKLVFRAGGRIRVPPESTLRLVACEITTEGAGAAIAFDGRGAQPAGKTARGPDCPHCGGNSFDFDGYKSEGDFLAARNRCAELHKSCAANGDHAGSGPVGDNGKPGATISITARLQAAIPGTVNCDVRPGCGGAGGPGGRGKHLYWQKKTDTTKLEHQCDGCTGDGGATGSPGTCAWNGTSVGTSQGCVSNEL